MTVASEISRITGNIADTYTAASGKGATIPATQDSDNLATCIASIPSGGGGTLVTKSITTNGVYDASNDNADGYSSVSAKVLPTVKANFAITSSDGTTFTVGNITKNSNILDSEATTINNTNFSSVYSGNTNLYKISLSAITTIGSGLFNSLVDICKNCTNLESVDFSSLTIIPSGGTFTYGFQGCTALNEVNFSSLTTISGYNAFTNAFQNCTALASINFPSLTTISGYNAFSNAFQNCTALTSVKFPTLTTISEYNVFYNAFQNCGLTSIEFPMLSEFTSSSGAELYGAFKGCTNIQNISFPAITTSSFTSANTFQIMLRDTGSAVMHTVHFPSNLESTIQGLTGYPLFGGDSDYVTLAFDLPATS